MCAGELVKRRDSTECWGDVGSERALCAVSPRFFFLFFFLHVHPAVSVGGCLSSGK